MVVVEVGQIAEEIVVGVEGAAAEEIVVSATMEQTDAFVSIVEPHFAR